MLKIKQLENKKILILGFNREGMDTFLFLRKIFPEKIFGIGDRNENVKIKAENVKWHLGENYLKALKDYEVIIKSPGIPIHLPEIEKAFKEEKITSQTEIFFNNCPGMIIGVTGTKGKSTTSSLIYQILKKDRLKARLVGNIERPVLSFLFDAKSDDIYVYELSCHQLYNLKKSPHIAVFLNLYPEHLDYYKDFEEYALTKENIAVYQNKKDYLIFNSEDKDVKEIAKKSKAKKIPIKGMYYDLDRLAAKKVGEIFRIPYEIIEQAIKEFEYLPYRLELVGTYKGITFYNDSSATMPEAAMAAIKHLGNKVETIILGGSEKNVSFKKLAKSILKNKIKTVILFPTTGKKIWDEMVILKKGRGLPKDFPVENMEDAVKIAYNHTNKGKICLLAPASASFGTFRDYKERGDLFKKFVKLHGGEKTS